MNTVSRHSLAHHGVFAVTRRQVGGPRAHAILSGSLLRVQGATSVGDRHKPSARADERSKAQSRRRLAPWGTRPAISETAGRPRPCLSSHPFFSVFFSNCDRLSAAYSSPAQAAASTTTLKPWPTPMVECRGDYSHEAFLERHIGGPLYDHQPLLPRLPVPSLEDTANRFLGTALPLAASSQEAQSLLEATRDFPKQASGLQQMLLRRAAESSDNDEEPTSWLQHWWNTEGHLKVRRPVVLNTSYFFSLPDDGTLPDNTTQGATLDQPVRSLGIKRGAALLVAAAEFRRQVCSGQRPADTIGAGPKNASIPPKKLCSTPYKYMFNACRVPQQSHDTYRIYDPSRHVHCIVAVRGQFYALEFVDRSSGLPFPLPVLEDRLQQCVDAATVGPHQSWPSLGVLTASDRDQWAEARSQLLHIVGPGMDEALRTLESGALLLCLDHDKEVHSWRQRAELYWHGGIHHASENSGTLVVNRWFDKSLQFICSSNGALGFLGEHSMMDGMPTHKLCNQVLATTYRDVYRKSPSVTASVAHSDAGVKNIFEECMPGIRENAQIRQALEKASRDFQTRVSDQELRVQSFHGYGSSYIKKEAGMSPDAYVQMAMQLATFRLFGATKQAGTYEASQVRPFLHGRTETTRAVSLASEAFVLAMGAQRTARHELVAEDATEKLRLLREAVANHVQYLRDAAAGHGVDRHFFGLSMVAQEQQNTGVVQLPSLFHHPLYLRSKYWRVSTSTLPPAPGFGEVVPDGVGIGYEVRSNSCIFTITARKEHDGWPERLRQHLEDALLEMKDLVEVDKMVQRKREPAAVWSKL